MYIFVLKKSIESDIKLLAYLFSAKISKNIKILHTHAYKLEYIY